MRGASLLIVGCLGVTASCGTPENGRQDVEVSITPFPYHADVHGADLPVEIGRFPVRAVRGSETNDSEFELGYVRYPSSENATGPPIVFLAAAESQETARQELYVTLRRLGDVVVFSHRGYGFSSPPAPCPELLNYPLAEPLKQALLDELMTSYAERCLQNLQSTGFGPEAYAVEQVALDFSDLAAALEVDELLLVAENSMSASAFAVLAANPELFSRVALVNPRITRGRSEEGLEAFLREISETPRGSATATDSVRGMIALLMERLRMEPRSVIVETQSGRQVSISVGDLDLAFVLARLNDEGATYLERLIAALADAVSEDYALLGELTLEMRQALSQPDPLAFVNAFGAADKPAQSELPPLTYALDWPASAMAKDPDNTQGSRPFASLDVPALVFIGHRNPSVSEREQKLATQLLERYQEIDVQNGGADLLDAVPQARAVLSAFLEGKPAE